MKESICGFGRNSGDMKQRGRENVINSKFDRPSYCIPEEKLGLYARSQRRSIGGWKDDGKTEGVQNPTGSPTERGVVRERENEVR
jgi:hypothetical protein